jgi:hypothetical protein
MRPESKAGSTSSPPVKPSHIAVPRVRVRLMAGANELNSTDPPPLKWSDLRYVFDIKEDCNGKEAIQA